MLYKIIVFTLLLFGSQIVNSQKEKDDSLGTWLVVVGNHRVSDKLSIPTVGTLRNYEFFHHYEFVFVRTGLTYNISPRFNATFGYAYLDTEPFIESPEALGAQQHWLYEQLTYKFNWANTRIANRVRVENRWKKEAIGTNLSHRARYRIQLSKPVLDNFYVKIFDEVFYDLQMGTFNQNRLFLGGGYSFTKKLSIEIGYLKNHFRSIAFDRLRIAILFKTDLRKNQQ